MDLTQLVYEISMKLPKEEKYELVSQIKRCAVSIPSNIAEGAGRGTDKDFKRFLEMALGSCNELETQLLLSVRLTYLMENILTEIFNLIAEIGNMLIALIRKLDTNI